MMKKSNWPPIKHSTYISIKPSVVFETLTTSKGWDSWFTQGTTIDAKKGGFIKLRWKNFGAGRFTLEDGGAILEFKKNRKLRFQWFPSSSPSVVEINLKPLGAGTFVELVEKGCASKIGDLKTLIGCATGWGEALTLLKFYLEYGVKYGSVPKG